MLPTETIRDRLVSAVTTRASTGSPSVGAIKKEQSTSERTAQDQAPRYTVPSSLSGQRTSSSYQVPTPSNAWSSSGRPASAAGPTASSVPDRETASSTATQSVSDLHFAVGIESDHDSETAVEMGPVGYASPLATPAGGSGGRAKSPCPGPVQAARDGTGRARAFNNDSVFHGAPCHDSNDFLRHASAAIHGRTALDPGPEWRAVTPTRGPGYDNEMQDNGAMDGERGRLRPDLGRITSSSTTSSSWSSASQLARGLGVVGSEAEASSGAATCSDMRISSNHRSSSADERFSASSLDLEEAEDFDGLSPLATVPGWGGCSPVRSSDRNAVINTSCKTTSSGLSLDRRELLPHSLQPAPQVPTGFNPASRTGQVQMQGAQILAFPDDGSSGYAASHQHPTSISHIASIGRAPPQPGASKAGSSSSSSSSSHASHQVPVMDWHSGPRTHSAAMSGSTDAYLMTVATTSTARSMAHLAGYKRSAAGMQSQSVQAPRGANGSSPNFYLWPVQAPGPSETDSVDLLPKGSPATTGGRGRSSKRRRLELGEAQLRGRARALAGRYSASELRHFGDGAMSEHADGARATTRFEPMNPSDGQASVGRTLSQARATASTVSPDSSVFSERSETTNLRWRRRRSSTASAATLCSTSRQQAAAAAVDVGAAAGCHNNARAGSRLEQAPRASTSSRKRGARSTRRHRTPERFLPQPTLQKSEKQSAGYRAGRPAARQGGACGRNRRNAYALARLPKAAPAEPVHQRRMSNRELSEYVARRDASGRFSCPQLHCGKSFRSGSDLVAHIRVHTREKPLLCPYAGCDYRGAHSSNLKQHVRARHEKVKRYTCPWPYCGKYYAHPSSRNDHYASQHLKVDLYKCSLCDQSFTAKANLVRHRRGIHKQAALESRQKVTQDELERKEQIKQSVKEAFVTMRRVSGGLPPMPAIPPMAMHKRAMIVEEFNRAQRERMEGKARNRGAVATANHPVLPTSPASEGGLPHGPTDPVRVPIGIGTDVRMDHDETPTSLHIRAPRIPSAGSSRSRLLQLATSSRQAGSSPSSHPLACNLKGRPAGIRSPVDGTASASSSRAGRQGLKHGKGGQSPQSEE